MADINSSLDRTEEQVRKLESEVVGLEKELEVIPSTVINSDVALSSFFDSTTEQVKNFRNQLKSAGSGTDFNKLVDELNIIRRNISDITSESARIAISAFDTSDSGALKSELNAVVRSFNAVDVNGTKVKDTIKSINPELGAVIEKAIYTTDLLETLMGFVTNTKLKDTTLQTDLAKGINLGMGDAKTNIESIKEQIDAQRKYLTETYPNGSQGLSDVKSRVVDEFFEAESELDAYNREVARLNDLEQKLVQTTADFAREQQEVNNALASNAQGDAMSKFRGYFDMYNVAYTTIGKLKQLSDVQDYLSNPFVLAEQSAEQLRANLEEIIPKANEVKINDPQTQLKAIEDEAEALRSIADRQSELLSSSKYITEETKNRLTSEEQLNALIAQRQQFNTEQLGLANRLANMRNVDEASKVLDLGKTADSNTFNAYMTQVEEAVREVQTLRENLLKAQNTMNSTNVGTSPFTNIINSADVEKLEKFQQLFNNGLKINAEGSDLNYIKQLGMYLDSVREIAKNFKSELGPEVAARFQMFSNLRSVENEGQRFNSSSTNINQEYINRARSIAQITKELETLNNNKDKITQNLDLTGYKEYEKLVEYLTSKLNQLKTKQEEVHDKMVSFGMQIPNTDNVRTTNDFAYSRNIHSTDENGNVTYDYKNTVGNIEGILKGFDQETEESKKKLQELQNKVTDVFNSIKKAVSNVIGVIRTMNTILNKSINAIVDGFKVVISTIQRVIQLFGNLGNRIGLTGKNTNILKGSFTELKSAIDLVVGAFNKLYNNQFIQQGKKLLSSVQTLNMLMGTQLTQSTIEWAEKMENAFGLSASDLIANLREVTAVMYGLGMTAQDVQVGARNLESVGMVLSSISGLSFETTMSKIQSGMKGMTQAIDDLGLSVRESQMDAYLKKLKAMGGEYANISTSFSSLTEQQRVYVRYAALMDQFTTKEAYSVERYAQSLRTTTGSLSVLTSQLAGLKSAIGTLGLGLFSKILMPLIYVVHYITQLIIQLGELLGINMKLSSEMNGGTPIDTTPIEDETKKLDEMADAASKAKGQLDELDHVTSMSSSSGSGKGGAGSDFDYSTLVGGFNFADALADVNENFLEECRQRLLGMLEQMKKDISDFVKDVTGRVIDWSILEERFKNIKQNIKEIFTGIGAVAENIFRTTAGLLYSIFDDMEFSKLFEKFTKNIADSLSVFNLILEKIAPYVQEFYNKYLSPYVIKFGEWLDSKLDDWGKKLHEITEYWIKLTPEQMEEGVDELGEKFNNLLTTLKQISIIIKTLFGKDTEKDNKFFNKTASDNMKKLKENVETLNGVFTALWDILKGILQDFGILDEKGNFSTEWIGPALDKINEKLGLVKDWLSENKETIIELGEKIIETIAKLAETKFDLLMDVLNWVTDHAELVNGMLDALQGILDFVDQHPMLSFGIAIGMQLAGKSLISGSGTLAGGAVSAILGVLSGSLKSLGKGMGRLILGGMSLATRIGSAIGGAWTTIAPKVGELATRIGTKISSGITTALNGIDWAALGTGAFGVGASAALLAGVKESFNTLDREIVGQDGNKWENIKDFETLDNQQLQKYANQYYKFLREKYGTEIPKMAIDWMVDSAKKQLEETGLYTAEQIERMGNIINEDIYNNINHPVANIAKTGDFDAIINKVTVTDEYIKELDTTFNTSMTNMSKSVMSLDDVIGDSTSSSVLDFDALKKAAEDAKNDMTVDLNNLDNVVRTSTSNISGNVVSLDDVINGTATSVNESINTIGGNLSDKTTEVDTNLTILQGAFKLLGTTVGDVATSISSSVGTITSKFTELFTNSHIDDLKDLNKDMDQLNQSVGFGIVNNTDTSVKKVRNFYGHANGGIPSTGSLFLANENGNAELVGNFGGYTGVANNDMIMKAMSSAVYDAVTAALKNNSTGGSTVIEVCKGGVFVGDDAAIRQLANKINNINLVSRNTIANTGFVMS